MNKIKFGRFEYKKNFKYNCGAYSASIYGWVTADDRVFNCIEVDGKAQCGEIEFKNIDAQRVRQSMGNMCVKCHSIGPMSINWWDCRKDRTMASCV